MIYLDTHVVVWYFANDKKRFSASLQSLMNQHDWFISPIVRLELEFLHEIGRVNPPADVIVGELFQKAGLAVCGKPFNNVVSAAKELSWTRDPFDRLLVAHAALNNDILITADQRVHAHYEQARW